jgi:hypothetical protein
MNTGAKLLIDNGYRMKMEVEGDIFPENESIG